MRNDTPDDMPDMKPIPESAKRQPGWRSPDLTEEERAELVRIQARANELIVKAREAEERTARDWATAVPLGVLAHWSHSLKAAAEKDPEVYKVLVYIADTYETGLREARQAQARTQLAELAGQGEHPLPCAEGEHRWETVAAKADEVPTSRCTRCSARRLDATPEQLYGRSADQ